MDRIFSDGDLDLSSAKILVVDDQVINIQAVNALLCEHYTILVATNGEDALKVAEDQLPDLILMDVVMPGMSGKEACMLLKAKEETAEIPVIFITTVSGEKDENECWESGGVDFIAKPFNPHTLKNRVRSHLELKFQKDILLKLAYSDGLTGVYNRRYFDEHYSKLIRLCYRNNLPLSILLLDIDYFKKFNDTYGHIAGDDALRSVAKAISSSLHRPADFVARYGGEEFVVLLPETNAEGAEYVTTNIIKAVSKLKIPHAESECKFLSLSIGVISLKGHSLEEEEILELVDKCLYEAKEQGRNCFISYKEKV
jgi:diguanylate cyclase (GGDEF)-like protein